MEGNNMLFVLGVTNMRIKQLEIKGLHNIYDYHIDFNDDLTFIYGENGCGKTTVLDIVTSIVTGKIYNLFSYNFSEIALFFQKEHQNKNDEIRIISYNGIYELSLSHPDICETIEDIQKLNDMIISHDEDELMFERRFMTNYEIPRFLRKNFNYIYLPLSRNSQDGTDILDSLPYRRRRAMLYSEKDFNNKNYLNGSLRYVEEIIRSEYLRISSTENMINAKFRSNILTSSLKVNNEYNFKNLFASVRRQKSLSGIEKNRTEYIKTLKSIGEWNEDTNKQVETFFEKYRTAFTEIQQSDAEGRYGVTVDFLLMNMEFNRIQEIAEQAQIIEKEKEHNRLSITTFLETVNAFFDIGEDKKQISINDEGKITVIAESPYRRLSLYNLSSGEKQIVIIFASLVFGLPDGKRGIYIIDEPEASLHLAWQKNFVASIQKVNHSVQLIFATHAPEIIGRFSNRTVKLQKKISPSSKERVDLFDE